MRETIFRSSIRLVLPSLLGAAGAMVAIMLPAYHAVFCGSSEGINRIPIAMTMPPARSARI